MKPLKLKPSYKNYIWGGEKLRAVYGKNTELPIIMMPRPKYYLSEEEKLRRDIVKKTYEDAIAKGDKNVYYISNEELVARCRGEETVEGIHPNDWGFASMAEAISKVIEVNGI